MSFSSEIRCELGPLPIKSLCCRRAFLYGLLYGAKIDGDTLTVTLPVDAKSAYDLPGHAAALIHSLFSRTPTVTPLTRGAHRYAILSFSYKVAARHIMSLSALPEEEAATETLIRALDLRCDACHTHFLRGLFLAHGTVNAPTKKNGHLEIKLPGDGRVMPVVILLTESGYEPGVIGRGETAGLFYKKAEHIQEVLALMGDTSRVFDLYNAQMQRELRNEINRSTNCETGNIRRSVAAGQREAHLLHELRSRRLLASLPPDLQVTAQLRLDHPEASLSELAALHDPPITKSGVRNRMEKILAFHEKMVRDLAPGDKS